jgi:hypothetical protein
LKHQKSIEIRESRQFKRFNTAGRAESIFSPQITYSKKLKELFNIKSISRSINYDSPQHLNKQVKLKNKRKNP